jgi:lysozyme family protein
MSAFTSAFAALIGNEGGYSDNPADPGGATMYGVTERVARAHGYTGDMRDLPLATAQAIAKAEYWDPVCGDQLGDVLAFQVFDAAYNSGVGRAAQWLQKSVGVTVDGQIGPITLNAVHARDSYRVCLAFNSIRLAFLASLPTWPDFGRGWANRIARNMLIAGAP